MITIRQLPFAVGAGVACLLVVGCGAGAPTSTTQTTITEHAPGIVEGMVVASPACPVVGPGRPCPSRPVGDVTVEVRRDGDLLIAGSTDRHGRFRLACPEGRVTVVARDDDGLGAEVSRHVVVRTGGTTAVTLPLDIGIR